ncbi:hypothetical protein BpHYR1_005355, partial [Brachionus plicatilis]
MGWQLCILARLSIKYSAELYVCCQRSESSKSTKSTTNLRFLGNLKAKVYEGDWKAKNLKQLENKTRTCQSNMDPKVVQDHANTVRSSLDIIRHHGRVQLAYINKKFNERNLFLENIQVWVVTEVALEVGT